MAWWFHAVVTVASAGAGAIASVTGFGIGSVLTPIVGLQVETRIAVAAVSIPHVIGTALRFGLMRGQVDRGVLRSFGLASAAGGLAGAILQEWISSPWLSVVFGGLLLFTAFSEFTGMARRMRFEGPLALIAGAASGLLGGLVGNQGGIRSGALMAANMPRHVFVATATAVGLIVDAARMPLYLITTGSAVLALWPTVAIGSAGVVAGTLLGHRLLSRMPEAAFRRVVAVLLALLGGAMMVKGLRAVV